MARPSRRTRTSSPARNPAQPTRAASRPVISYAGVAPADPSRWRRFCNPRFISLLIVVLTLAAFLPALLSDFINVDDPQTIALNPKLNPPTFASLAEFWNPARPQMDLYVPVTYTTWAALAKLAYLPIADPSGVHLNPAIFHGANVLLHAGSALMVFRLLLVLLTARRWSAEGQSGRAEQNSIFGMVAAGGGALLFALHPVQVESVAWASGTKDVLWGLLSLTALWGYVRLATQKSADEVDRSGPAGAEPVGRSPFRSRWYLISSLAFVLAMLSKPTAVVTPLIAATIDWLVLRRRLSSVVRLAGPWLLLAVPVLIEGRFAQPAGSRGGFTVPLPLRPLVATDALAFYLYKLVWPARLGVIYNRSPQAVIAHGWLYWTWLVPLALAAICVIPLARHGRRAAWPAAALAIFCIGVLPVLGLVPFDFQQFSTTADHYLYLTMIGPAVAGAFLLRWYTDRTLKDRARLRDFTSVGSALRTVFLPGNESVRSADPTQGAIDIPARRPFLVITTTVLVLALLGTRTFLQARVWHDSITLLENAIRVNSFDPNLYDNLGRAYADAGMSEAALHNDEEAVRKWPRRAASHVNLGTSLTAIGRFGDAETQYKAALEIDPSSAGALRGLEMIDITEQTFRHPRPGW